MRKSVLVTGASGFVGSAVAARLAADWDVTPLGRAMADLDDVGATRMALDDQRWDAVVHLAGPAPKAALDWPATVDVMNGHVRTTMNLLAAIPPSFAGRFVSVSGMIVYGLPATPIVAEDHPRRPLHPYALAKCLAEDAVFASALSDRWLLRPGGIFSPRRTSGGLFAFARAAKKGEPIRAVSSSPPVPWDITDLDDVAEAVARALASPARDPGAVNIAYGEPIELSDVARRIARIAGSDAGVVLEGPPPPVFHSDITKAKSLFAWPPATLDERLARIVEAA